MEMSPRVWHSDWALRIHEEDNEVTRLLAPSLAKVSECLITAAAGMDAESAGRKTNLLEELTKPPTASGGSIGVFVVTAAVDIDADTHQRLPPISPFRQRCPRL
jgi:hypothetical protein